MKTGRWKVMAVIATVTVRPFARRVATVPPARSIWERSQPPKMSPCGLASAGIAIARNVGSLCGGGAELSLAGMENRSGYFGHGDLRFFTRGQNRNAVKLAQTA